MEIKKVISEYLKSELPIKEGFQWDDNTNLINSGALDSLSIVRLIAFIEEEFDISLDQYLELNNFESISAMASVVDKELAKNE